MAWRSCWMPPAEVSVSRVASSSPGGHVPQELDPHGEGKHVPGHRAADKVRPVGPLGGRLDGGRLGLGGRRQRGRLLPLQVADVIAPLGQGIQEALGHQLGVGALYGDGADAQVLGKGPLGGELLPRPELLLQNILLDASVEMFIHALRVDVFKGIGEQSVPFLSLVFLVVSVCFSSFSFPNCNSQRCSTL